MKNQNFSQTFTMSDSNTKTPLSGTFLKSKSRISNKHELVISVKLIMAAPRSPHIIKIFEFLGCQMALENSVSPPVP